MSNQITVLPVCLPGSATVRYGWTIQELHPIIPVAADALCNYVHEVRYRSGSDCSRNKFMMARISSFLLDGRPQYSSCTVL